MQMNYKLLDRVIISHESFFDYRTLKNNKTIKILRNRKLKEPIVGYISRRIWKKEGILYSGGQTGYPDYEYEQGYLKVLKQKLCYEVSFNIHRKPILVNSNFIKKI